MLDGHIMFYIMYLEGLCQRRHWHEPSYSCIRNVRGYLCTVRVNSREYSSEGEYDSEEFARNAAALRAYMVCRHFSISNGVYPGREVPGDDGVIQGQPVAIGTGRLIHLPLGHRRRRLDDLRFLSRP